MITNNIISGIKERILPQHDPKEERPVTVGTVIVTILCCLLFFGIMYAISLLAEALLPD